MNKIFIRGLLMVALVLGTLGSVSSCKDNVEDLRADLVRDQLTLKDDYQGKIDALRNALNQRIDSLKNLPHNPGCTCDLTPLQNKIDSLNHKIDSLKNLPHNQACDLTPLKNKIDSLNNRIDSLKNLPHNPACDLTPLQNKLDSLNKIVLSADTAIIKRLIKVEELMAAVMDGWTPESGYTIPDIHKLAVKNGERIDSLARVTQQDSAKFAAALKDSINQLRLEAKANLDSARKYTDAAVAGLKLELNTRIDSLRDALNTRLDSLEEKYNSLEARVAKNEKDIKDLQNRMTALENRVENMVTSVVVQGVENPIFGSFALPVNVQSNILLAYYGECDLAEIQFPMPTLNNEYNGATVISSADWERMGGYIKPIDGMFNAVKGEAIYTETAGKVYLTINPNNVDFTQEGKTVSLVNSLDEESGIKLGNIKKSDKLLTFGYTRANNGFYEADATLNPDEISAVKINIDENLKSAVKGVLKDHSRQDFAQLIKAVYDQFNGILPANAVKASWNINDKDYAVYSNYNIAATAFKPLSFKFLYGKEFSKRIPTIDPISIPNIDLNNYINFDDIKMPEIKIDEINVEIELGEVNVDELGQLYVVVRVPKTDADGKVIIKEENGEKYIEMYNDTVYVDEQQLKDFANKIAKQLGGDMEEQVKAAMDDAMKQVAQKIQAAMDDALTGPEGIMTQITDKINDLNKTLNDKIRGNFGAYVDKLNNYINKINRFTNRINRILKDPNHYLQVTMLYELNGEYHQLSNNKYIPTYAKLAGGNAIELYPTTYTAELVAPAFKKYVAVTNVYDAEGNSNQDLINNANAQEYINTVINGDRLAVPLYVPANAVGYTYEIAYSALDYQGVSSTQKFYVKIVK